MDFVVSPSDLERTLASVRGVEPNPFKVAARLAGLGDAEVKAGVPAWAWVAVALAGGVALGFYYGPRVSKKLRLK
jgi:hypothetical protein